MTDTIAAMRQALDALESCEDGGYSAGHVNPSFDRPAVDDAMIALRAAIEQAEAGQAAPDAPAAIAAKFIAEDEAHVSNVGRLMKLGRELSDAVLRAAPTSPAWTEATARAQAHSRRFEPAAPVEPVAWRVRGYAQFKRSDPGPWRYFTCSDRPSVNHPEDCDFVPLYTAPPAAPTAAAPPDSEGGETDARDAGWVPMHEGAPEPDTDCLTLVRYSLDRPPFLVVDRWEMQHEDPIGMGGATIETGYGWNDNHEGDVIAWKPVGPVPPVEWDQRLDAMLAARAQEAGKP